MLKKIVYIYIFLVCNVFADDIPLPPMVSLKQEQSIAKIQSAETNEKPVTPIIVKENPMIQNIQIKIGISKEDSEIYLPLASTICIFMNEQNSNSCRIQQYDSTITAIHYLLKGDIDLLLTNSLISKLAVDNMPPFENLQTNQIRFIMSFFNEKVYLLSRRDVNIKQIEDLKNTSINVGQSFSKNRVFFEDILKIKTWKNNVLKSIFELNQKDQIKAICDSNLSTIIIIGEEMNNDIKEATRLCELNMIEFSNDEMDLILSNNSQYVSDKVLGGEYIGIPRDVNTVAIKAVLLSTTSLSNIQAKTIVNFISNHLSKIKLMHVSLKNLTLKTMLTEGRIAPLHDGITNINQ